MPRQTPGREPNAVYSCRATVQPEIMTGNMPATCRLHNVHRINVSEPLPEYSHKKVIVQQHGTGHRQGDMIQASRITPFADRNRVGLASIGPLDPDCASFLVSLPPTAG